MTPSEPNPSDLCANCGRRYDAHLFVDISCFCGVDSAQQFRPQPQKEGDEKCSRLISEKASNGMTSPATEVANVAQFLKSYLSLSKYNSLAIAKWHLDDASRLRQSLADAQKEASEAKAEVEKLHSDMAGYQLDFDAEKERLTKERDEALRAVGSLDECICRKCGEAYELGDGLCPSELCNECCQSEHILIQRKLSAAHEALKVARDSLAKRINGCTLKFYLNSQFPTTLGHIPLDEWFKIQEEAIAAIDKVLPKS